MCCCGCRLAHIVGEDDEVCCVDVHPMLVKLIECVVLKGEGVREREGSVNVPCW